MGTEIQRAERFADELVRVFGDELTSVVLYGSAARDQFHEGVSDLNVLVLLRSVDPAVLRRGSAVAREWVLQQNPPPLLLSEEELKRSLDVFPIEYSDIRDAHRVLYGSAPFATLQIDPIHLRLQCERELKTRQIQLREQFLLSAEEPEELDQLLRRSISSFLVLFRTALRLVEQAVPAGADEVVRALAEQVGYDPDPLLEVLEARRSGKSLDASAPRLAPSYLAAIGRVVTWVDALERV